MRVFLSKLFFLASLVLLSSHSVFAQEEVPVVPEEETPATESAPAPDLRIAFRGTLKNAAALVVPDGLYHVRFRIYPDPVSSDVILWEETFEGENRIQVVNGVLQVVLGRSGDLRLEGWNRYFLSITIGGSLEDSVWDAEMMPRKEIVTAAALLEQLETEQASQAKEEELITLLLEQVSQRQDVVVVLDVATLEELLRAEKKEAPELSQTTDKAVAEVTPPSFSIVGFLKPILSFWQDRLQDVLDGISRILETLQGITTKIDAIYRVVVEGEASGSAIELSPPVVAEPVGSESVDPQVSGQTTGVGTVATGSRVVRIDTPLASPESLILITFASAEVVPFEVTVRGEGYFVLELSGEAPVDYAFSWWILNDVPQGIPIPEHLDSREGGAESLLEETVSDGEALHF